MKKMISSFVFVVAMILLSGCVAEKRQYFKIANGGSGNFEVDKAQCEYQAELNTKIPNRANITVNVDNRQGTTNYSNVYGQNKGYSGIGTSMVNNYNTLNAAGEADKKIQRLTDLCLKSKGWSWNVIK